MDDSPSPDDTRDFSRRWLIACTVLAVVAAGVVLPAFATGGIAGSPLERLMPGDPGATAGLQGGSGAGGLGALNPGSSTGVGGEVGLNSETFASTSTATHFVVQSDQPTYWRTATYDRYTGSGWEQTGGTSAYDGTIEHRGSGGERVEYDLTLERSATAIPTAYRPRTVDGADELVVTDGGAVHSRDSVGAGTTIQGVSDLPERDPDLLAAAGTDYPDEIEQRYTQLPDDTPDRLTSLTSELTVAADSPYETADTIQDWLRAEKSYSLGASRQSDTIATTFVFDMSAGYCEYFASAMTVMLRSQGIPARYVVGYTTGQEVSQDTYQVRGMNAHAWVEVYFPDVGWVRFDPTPGDARLSAYESALAEAGESPDLREIGSPGETFQPGQIDGEEDNDESDGESGYSTSLNRTAVPGVGVEVTVTRNEEPVQGATVLFNDEPIGVTDSDGTVVGTVPDDEELRIGVREPGVTVEDLDPPAERTGDRSESTAGEASAPSSGATATQRVDGSTLTGGGGVASASLVQRQNDTTVTGGVHPIEDTASIEVTGDVRAGESVSVLVRVGDVRLDGASVFVDGREVAQTDEGEARIPLPAEPGDVAVRVEWNSVTGERTIRVPELDLSLSGDGVPLPGREVTVVAELDGEPVAGAVVERNGQQVATTDANGTATVTLGLDSSTTITVAAAGQRRSTTVTGAVRNTVALGGLLLVGVVGGGYAGYRRRRRIRGLARSVPRLPRLLTTSILAALISLATAGDSRATAGVPTENTNATDAGSDTTLRTRLGGLLANLRGRLSRNGHAQPRSRDASQVTIREAWARFLGQLGVNDARTHTPGELATHAVEEEDLPEEPVRTLRDTFRAVEYGARSPTDRLERVQDALAEIERIEPADDARRTDGGRASGSDQS